MASLKYQSDTPRPFASPRVWFEPVCDHRLLLDGSWWPGSDELGDQLRALLPILDRVRGPVTRLLLSAAGWTSRPHEVTMGDRTVTVGYLADQPPSMMTVLCVDGGTFMMRVAPFGPAPSTAENQD